MNIPLNSKEFKQNSIYLAFYDEIFINGQREIGAETPVELYDRNRAYTALGYGLTDRLRMQFGYMQQTTNAWNKGLFQQSLDPTIP